MRGKAKLRFCLLLFGTLLACGLVVWTQSRNLRTVADIRKNAEAAASERFHNAPKLEVRIRRINSLFFRHSLGLIPGAKPRIDAEQKELEAWLQLQKRSGLSGPEQVVFRAIEQTLANYFRHSHSIFTRTLPPAELPKWRAEKEEFMAKLLSLCGELKEVEERALNAYLQESRASVGALEESLLSSSFLLVSTGALIALLVYSGVIDPLRASLRRSKSVIERQEKLSALGMLAAGVAHEIRNPLTSIKARLFTQKELLTEGSEAWEDNHFIEGEITRLERIVRDILAFAKPTAPQLAPVRASNPVREVSELLEPELSKDSITLEQQFETDPVILVDRQQLKQVLINLIKNAAESIGSNGKIIVRTGRFLQHGAGPGKSLAVVEVEDNGKGVSADVQARLFDPFFTTKASGTGLGLSTAARILEAHKGTIDYRPASGERGAIFRLAIPEIKDDQKQASTLN